ncbi:MAG: alpha/beta hydrolase fold domain-containing protein [Proteobacteria bacterium]|nr:alpha/beta hydrolase fold domain-containing protein [Pseudomonadota bacterium]
MSSLKNHLPGRLGNPHSTLETDARLDPRIKAALELVGGLAEGFDPPALDASYEECLAYCQLFEDTAAAAHPQMLAAMPAVPLVATTTEVIRGVDGNEITLYIHQPVDRVGLLPCIVHTHGGGMVLMTATDPMYIRLRNDLASLGMVVIGVEFRNGGGRLGNHPFPAGLNDCASAAQWAHANRAQLGASCIVISGESGGGNLSIATTLKAKQEGRLDQIDGVYSLCPYVCGSYAEPPANLRSLVENDQYLLSGPMMSALVRVYDPQGDHARDPLAWPLQAGPDDLQGLPPVVISVNELDPLRDEGLALYRKLGAAGVAVTARTVHGTPHGGDLSYPDIVPNVYQETIRSIYGFARSLV